MPDILVRGLDVETVKRLKARAQRHGRSQQSEVKILVERAAGDGDISASGRRLRASTSQDLQSPGEAVTQPVSLSIM